MAFPNLGPQTIGQVGNLTSILNWIKPQIPTRYYKAINILFHPCCELVIAGVSFVASGGAYNTTVTLVNPVSYYDVPKLQLIENGVVVSNTGVQTSPTTIVFSNVTLTAGSFGLAVIALIPTSSDGNTGVYSESVPLIVTVP